MAQFNITASQLRVAKQRIQNKYVRIELLNHNFQVVDNLEGVCLSGSISIDADSDIRRTGNIKLVVTDSSFDVQVGGKIWLDKYVKVYVGIEVLTSDEIVYTNCGIYIIDQPSFQYDATNNTLGLSLIDLMGKLTGVRNGVIQGLPVKILAGENIRSAIVSTLVLGGFDKYVVEQAPSPSVVPNDLEFNQGVTVYEILASLRDIYPNYEMYFDVDGVFHYNPIPTGANEAVQIDDALWENIVVSETVDVDFDGVKNVIEVYGRTHDPTHYSDTASVSGSTVTLIIADVAEYTEDEIYGFTMAQHNEISSPYLKINSLGSYPVRLDGSTTATIPAEGAGAYYCVQWKGTYWRYLGHLQSQGYAEDINPDSAFYINSSIGRIREVVIDENYMTDDLAQGYAEYLLWQRTNMKETLKLTCTVVEWLDVNALVRYTSYVTKSTNDYIIKNISFGLAPSDSMTLTMIKFYPEYSYI